MASGKSTVAARLASARQAELVTADAIRQELFEAGAGEAMAPGFSDTVYAELLRRARRALAGGRSVVLDGSFRTRGRRRAARELARELGVAFRVVECRADPDTCRARLRVRERQTGQVGWSAMFEHFLEGWEPLEELPDAERVRIDTNGSPAALEIALSALGLIPSPCPDASPDREP